MCAHTPRIREHAGRRRFQFIFFCLQNSHMTEHADVQLRTLRANEARQALSNPVEIRNGAVRSITLTIPLLSDNNSYLVVRLPDASVQGLLTQARTLPEADRPGFIRDWIMRNQQAVIEQHLRAGGRDRRFRYDVVPVPVAQPRTQDSTPRRVEPTPQPPVTTSVPSRTTSPQSTPPQQAAPATPPQQAAPVAPPQQAQPQQPQTRGRTIQPGAPTAPVVAPPVSTQQPTERPIVAPAPQQRQEEQWWLGGEGTRRSPYRIRLLTRRATGNGTDASELIIPISVTSVGRFEVSVTLNQVSASRFEASYNEILQLIRRGYAQTEGGRGGTVRLSGIPPMATLRSTLYGQLPADLRRYAETH